MFDTTLIASNARREVKRKLATLPAALAVHAMALGFVMVGQLWAVDQVPEMVTVPPLIVHILPPMGGDGDGRHAGQHIRRTAPSHVARPTLVQPSIVPLEIPKNAGPEPPGRETVPGSERIGEGEETPEGPDTGPDTGSGDDAKEVDPPVGEPIQIGGDVKPPVPIDRKSVV